MHRFYQAQNEIEAQLLIDYLHSSHIQAVMLGQYLSGAAGDLSALNFPWVWLMEARDVPRATQLLEEFRARRSGIQDQPDWTCPSCGHAIDGAFDLCWNCGEGRPL